MQGGVNCHQEMRRLGRILRVKWSFIWALRDKKCKACFQKGNVMNKRSVKEIDVAFLTQLQAAECKLH